MYTICLNFSQTIIFFTNRDSIKWYWLVDTQWKIASIFWFIYLFSRNKNYKLPMVNKSVDDLILYYMTHTGAHQNKLRCWNTATLYHISYIHFLYELIDLLPSVRLSKQNILLLSMESRDIGSSVVSLIGFSIASIIGSLIASVVVS